MVQKLALDPLGDLDNNGGGGGGGQQVVTFTLFFACGCFCLVTMDLTHSPLHTIHITARQWRRWPRVRRPPLPRWHWCVCVHSMYRTTDLTESTNSNDLHKN